VSNTSDMSKPPTNTPSNRPSDSRSHGPTQLDIGVSGSGVRFDIELRLLSNPMYLSGARDLVTNIAGRCGFDELGCGKLALAIDEALCNIIRHGYDDRTDCPIAIFIGFTDAIQSTPGRQAESRGPRSLVVIIEDEGHQVDPATIVGRPLEEVRPGGLGVHIIREIMDEVVFEKRETVGMRLIMRKALPEPDAETTSAPTVRYGGHEAKR
jgi:serine/threonine-protein kinase RsbW